MLNGVLLLLQTHGHYSNHPVTLITAARLRVLIASTTRRKDGQ